MIGRHVGHLHDEHEVRPRRHAPALLHRRLLHGAGLEGVQVLGALAVQRDLQDGGQAGAQFVGRQDGHAALDDAGVHQALHAAQAGGGRHGDLGRQVMVAQRGVRLQRVQQPQINGIQFIHKSTWFE